MSCAGQSVFIAYHGSSELFSDMNKDSKTVWIDRVSGEDRFSLRMRKNGEKVLTR